MRKFNVKAILTSSWTPCLIGFPLAISAFATTEKLWVAQPTGVMQCQPPSAPTLDRAVASLENQGVVVHQSLTGTLDDRMTCSACNFCPDGSYNIAEIDAADNAEEIAQNHGWELIDANTIKVEE